MEQIVLNESILKDVGEKILAKRNSMGMRRNFLVEKSGVSSPTIEALERGVENISLSKVIKIAEALGMRVVIDIVEK